MLQKLNKQLERLMPFITPTSVVIGVLLAGILKDYSFLIPWIFAFMTFSGSLSSNFSSLKQTLNHPFALVVVLFILHILMPVWAWGVGHIVFSGDLFTITGFILAMAIPTGISSFIWVSIYRGNLSFTLAIILIDTFLSPFIVPFTLSILVGENIEMDVFSMMKGLLGMIVIPSLLGMFLNQWTKGKVKEEWSPRLAPFSKIGMGFVVMLNGAVVAPYLQEVNMKLVIITITVFFIAFTGYLFSFLIGKWFKCDREMIIALTFTGGMRNISAGAVIAVSYFPPQVAVPVVIGMLFQQVLASIYGMLMERHFNRTNTGNEKQAM
ncbi:putative Na+-dependent transporter [Cytobacillus eiseniae]|uniref:Na+-dependent transporter n=1 Tax=Cytobacillus eiseniae TaxID=762947 RepID=A0ABS4R9S7_9BACI|nr:bile acid:sodium symporter family protein [Cytobacillus eiseniae]MBP2239650.1 putative Na+-dependent transporter [Cytobacillus eiseniae]